MVSGLEPSNCTDGIPVQCALSRFLRLSPSDVDGECGLEVSAGFPRSHCFNVYRNIKSVAPLFPLKKEEMFATGSNAIIFIDGSFDIGHESDISLKDTGDLRLLATKR